MTFNATARASVQYLKQTSQTTPVVLVVYVTGGTAYFFGLKIYTLGILFFWGGGSRDLSHIFKVLKSVRLNKSVLR